MGSIIKNGINYTGGSGASSYNELSDKPSIENIPLSGNKSASDLGLIKESDLADVATTGDYDDLIHKPSIPVILDNIADVDVSSPTNGQVLKYNSTSGMWENANESGGGSSYTAGDGVDITNNVISTKQSEEGDIDEIIDVYPQAGNLVSIVNAFNKGDIYSTNEKMIGQWVDGKPLYQKVIGFSFSQSETTKEIDSTLTKSYIAEIVGINGGYIQSDGNKVPIPRTPTSQFNGITVYVSDAGLNIVRSTNTPTGSGNINIQYTKVSDTAISIGEATEYSTDEKIVGTWIDGKPLWQITLTGTLTPSSGNRVYNTIADLTSLNIDKLISGNGSILEDSGYFKVLNFADDSTTPTYNIALKADKILALLTNHTVQQLTYYVTIQYTKTTT